VPLRGQEAPNLGCCTPEDVKVLMDVVTFDEDGTPLWRDDGVFSP